MFITEQAANDRYVAKPGHLCMTVLICVLQQPAEYDDLTIISQEGALNKAFVQDHAAWRVWAGDIWIFLVNLELDDAALSDLRFDIEHNAHILAVKSLERRAGCAAALLRVCTHQNRDILADQHLRRLIIQRHHRRRREHIGAAQSAERL